MFGQLIASVEVAIVLWQSVDVMEDVAVEDAIRSLHDLLETSVHQRRFVEYGRRHLKSGRER